MTTGLIGALLALSGRTKPRAVPRLGYPDESEPRARLHPGAPRETRLGETLLFGDLVRR